MESYRLSEEGIRVAKELLKSNREMRDFFMGTVTNHVIGFMNQNHSDPVKIILKILEVDMMLREDGLDWEEFLLRLVKTEEGYIVKEVEKS